MRRVAASSSAHRSVCLDVRLEDGGGGVGEIGLVQLGDQGVARREMPVERGAVDARAVRDRRQSRGRVLREHVARGGEDRVDAALGIAP